MEKKLLLITMVFFFLSLTSAAQYEDCDIYGNCQPIKTAITFNNNTANVNHSLTCDNATDAVKWDGHAFVPGAVSSIEVDPVYDAWYDGSNGVCNDGTIACGFLTTESDPLSWHSNNQTEDRNFLTSGNITVGAITGNPTNNLSMDFIFGSNETNLTGAKANRMFFDISKGAFRAGQATAAQWDDNNVGEDSWAGGFDSEAIGMASFAFGGDCYSFGNSAISMGNSVVSYGKGAVAMGYNENGDGSSFRAGSTITSKGSGQIVLGSATMGYTMKAEGNGSIAIGQDINSLTNDNVLVFGKRFTASEQNSFNVGFNDINFKVNQTGAYEGNNSRLCSSSNGACNLTIMNLINTSTSNSTIWWANMTNINQSKFQINNNLLDINLTWLYNFGSVNWTNIYCALTGCNMSGNINLNWYNITDAGFIKNVNTTVQIGATQTNVTYDFGCTGAACILGTVYPQNPFNFSNNVVINQNFSAKRPYGMYASLQTQTIYTASTATNVTFNQTEAQYMMNISSDRMNFTVYQSGIYLFEISAIFNVDTANKHVEFWARKNNVDIPRSNTKMELPTLNTEIPMVVPLIISMNTTDQVRFMMASDDAGSTMVDTPKTAYSPESPSVILTITKLSELT